MTVTVLPDIETQGLDMIFEEVPEEVLVPCFRMLVDTDRLLGYVGV